MIKASFVHWNRVRKMQRIFIIEIKSVHEIKMCLFAPEPKPVFILIYVCKTKTIIFLSLTRKYKFVYLFILIKFFL